METADPPGSPWTFEGESSYVGDSSVTLVDGTSFLVCGRSGDIVPTRAHGLFMLDTRILSRWSLTVNGRAVETLSVSPNGPFSATFVGRITDPSVIDPAITVVQRRHIGRGMREDLEIRNHARSAMRMRVELALASDFGSLFDVKAGIVVAASCTLVGAGEATVELVPRSEDLPRPVDATVVSSSVRPDAAGDHSLVWDIEVAQGQSWSTCLLVGARVDDRPIAVSYGCGQPVEDAIPVSRLRRWRNEVTSISTDSAVLATAVDRASEDLGALRIFDPEHPERVVVAAGAPWFMTLFGRDSLLASWMALPIDQDLAVGVLRELADSQGQRIDAASEEQPGRILHEVRFDRATSRLLGGTNTYFGTADATPLFVMMVAELARWTGLTPTIEELIPAVDRAMEWIDTYGDRDGDGFVEYLRSDPNGLENQGWKDSWDGIRHLDGSVARAPIALCEVQGYVYAALRSRAELGRARGEAPAVTRALDARAEVLQQRFHEAFWLDEYGWYAVGLDSEKQPIASLTSNLGHLLWTGIVPEHYAGRLAQHLSGPSMFTGWGLRTLAADAAGYNPLSYHCGSVWPHDTAIAVAGLARYGYDEQAQALANGLLAASAQSGGRLPELFGGFDRADLRTPVPYPASCSPQAWAAASPLLLVRAMLGLEPNLLTGYLRLRPRLPTGIERLGLSAVPLGEQRIDITLTGTGIEVSGLDDQIVLEIN